MESIQISLFGKTSPAPCRAPGEKISGQCSRHSPPLQEKPYLSLDLRGDGLPQERSWETVTRLPGEYWTRNTGECPSAVVESTLSSILQDTVPPKYYLTARACHGILARAERRGKPLPAALEEVLRWQADHYDQLTEQLMQSGCEQDAQGAEREPLCRPRSQVLSRALTTNIL